MRLDCVNDKSKLNLLQEEEGEEVVLHLPLQNVREEQIQMIILQPVSQVKVPGVGTLAGRKKTGTGKIELAHIPFYRCECRRDL